jgi:hypothetical protein
MPRKPHLSGRWQLHAPGQLNMIEFKKAIKVPEIFADLISEFARILTDIKQTSTLQKSEGKQH